jgi:hypothetical protein
MVILLFSTPPLIAVYTIGRHQLYAESIERAGLAMSHGPILFGAWLAMFLAVGVASKLLWKRSWPLVAVFAVASLCAINKQMLSGISFLPHRYHWLVIQPYGSLFVLAAVFTIGTRFIRSAALRYGLVIAFIVVCCGVGFMQQRGAYMGNSLLWGRLQQAAPAIKYVGEKFRPGQTVYSQDRDILAVIPAYTSADVSSDDHVSGMLMSVDRLRFAYFFHLWLIGLRPDEAEKVFASAKRAELSGVLYGLAYRESGGVYEAIPDESIASEAAEYRNYVRLSLKEKLALTPVTAIVTTPHDVQNPVWTMFLRCAKSVYSSGGYDVLLLRPAIDPTSCLR